MNDKSESEKLLTAKFFPTDAAVHNENTPLLGNDQEVTATTPWPNVVKNKNESIVSHDENRMQLFNFLEARSKGGMVYEKVNIFLILVSVLLFVVSSLFVKEYNPGPLAEQCGKYCDAIWFGNDPNNALSSLGIGATSILEILIVFIFTVDYLLRFYTADLLDSKYQGFFGRLRFIVSFYSIVDLMSTVPFYVDAFLLPDKDLASSNFLRMFRLFRMMRVEGRYDLALNLIDDVIYEQRGMLATALFVGITVWGVLSSFFYLAERRNHAMIYCGLAPLDCSTQKEDIDTNLCIIDEWGFVDCSAAGCENVDGRETCWNVYRSIVDASFWTLMQLFGEFPLVDQHSAFGKLLGTFTAIFACAVFALPAGIFGSGFEDQIARRRKQTLKYNDGKEAQNDVIGNKHEVSNKEDSYNSMTLNHGGTRIPWRRRIYNFIHVQNTQGSKLFEILVNTLVVGSLITFMLDTMSHDNTSSQSILTAFSWLEFVTVTVFTIEYILGIYSIPENQNYTGFRGRLNYAKEFMPLVDLLSFSPYWIELLLRRKFITASNKWIKFLRILRILRFEKYTKAFTSFDEIIRENLDVLGVTGFSAVILWILFSAILYYIERNNPDDEIANYYKTIPHAMWITLLNLSGECPLAHYSLLGKIMMGIIGLFATAIFGVPIGILGAGFEQKIADKEDESIEDEDDSVEPIRDEIQFGIQATCYRFVNGIGSTAASLFELLIYSLIILTVVIGIVQTLPGYEDLFQPLESMAVFIFTLEYIIRLVGVGADYTFTSGSKGCLRSRIDFIFSFYSVIDLLAILPSYLAYCMPGSWFDEHDEYFRMLRLFRLLKLDKYFPSISLIDDVLRLKRGVITTSCLAAGTLWILFTGLMYLAENQDVSMDISDLPLYGCITDCKMATRYTNFFTSFPLTGIHLTGDYPMTEYGAAGRVVCFFMVIAAVGVVSVPSGLIASGFAEIVQSKVQRKQKHSAELVNAGDDWFEIKYRELQGIPPPPSMFGQRMDQLQIVVHEYLDGKENAETGVTERTLVSKIGRVSFFALIMANVFAVIIESIPEVDRYIGNEPGNVFDVFEDVSVLFFTVEYLLRLFSASKSRNALYSPWVYSITFFGLVDLISIAPWYVEFYLQSTGHFHGDVAKIFRIVRIFRVLQLEDFIVAFSKLDNVFRASKTVLQATGLMALIIWVGASALFFLFERNNPNFRVCDASVPLVGSSTLEPGCYDFQSTDECNAHYEGMCHQAAFTNMPNTMFYVAVFLGGDWGFVDFTWKGKIVCMFLCVAGIALYAIPVGTLFDSFGAVIGLCDQEEMEEEEGGEEGNEIP